MQTHGDVEARTSNIAKYMSGETYLIHYDYKQDKVVALPTEEPVSTNIKKFISSTPKVVVQTSFVYYHLLVEFFGYLAKELESHDGSKRHYIFSLPASSYEVEASHTQIVFRYFGDKLKALGHDVDYCVGFFDQDNKTLINNFMTFTGPYDPTLQNLRALTRLTMSDRSNETPTRKIYISRAKTTSLATECNTIGFEKLGANLHHGQDSEKLDILLRLREEFKYQFTDRIDDEEALENYLRTLGFDIVYPEDFESFEEQIHAISSAKILISITSSALSSSVFMNPSSIVIELTTALMFPSEENEDGTNYRSYFQEHYSQLCKGHEVSYLSIHHRRVASELIEKIENNSSIKALLSS